MSSTEIKRSIDIYRAARERLRSAADDAPDSLVLQQEYIITHLLVQHFKDVEVSEESQSKTMKYRWRQSSKVNIQVDYLNDERKRHSEKCIVDAKVNIKRNWNLNIFV